MGIETKYEYIYYTVIDTEQWRRGNEDIWGTDGFTWDAAANFVQHKLKTSEDDSVKKYKVEYAQFCDDIGDWRNKHIQHDEMPVFIQFQQDQEIKREGEGDLFILYEDDGVHYSSASDDDDDDALLYRRPDAEDGLAGYGGRL